MKIIYTILIIWSIVCILRLIRWRFASRVERPAYEIISSYDNNIEIRRTKEQLYATVTVAGTDSSAPNKAFGLLADFIFGNNTRRDKVAMTAPVVSQSVNTSESISMTAPVISQAQNAGMYEVSFIMPAPYTIDTIPTPNNDLVRLHTVTSKTLAAITFWWYTTQSSITEHREILLTKLASLGIQTTGESIVAQYNDPRTPPFMRRNEIWIETISQP